MTLLHYLVETIESKFPELLTFNEDLAHVDKAARVSVETIQKTLRQMETSIRNLESDLNNSKQPQGDDDTFSEVMGVSFTFGGYIVSVLLLRGPTFGFNSINFETKVSYCLTDIPLVGGGRGRDCEGHSNYN
jgi:hypothetical protein